jgi:hypothetical protein
VIVRSTINVRSAAGEQEVPVVYRQRTATLTTPPCQAPGHRGPVTVEVTVPKVEAAALNEGAFPARALTSVSPPIQERFVTGLCPRCWDRLHGG